MSVWGGGTWLDPARRAEAREAAAAAEQLGYRRLWVSGGQDDGVSDLFADLLAATRTIGVASGIVSIWKAAPEQCARAVAELEAAHPGRFVLGLGNSHAPLVERTGQAYSRPYARTVEHLDALDAAEPPVPERSRALAALGPRMLRLARDRSLGAHPYFVPAEHTAVARRELGPGPLLAPEVAVVLDEEPGRARATARRYMAGYLQLPNYTQNLRRLGWGDADLDDGGSDRLVDALIPWGDAEAVAAGLLAHVDAGADEVAVQVLPVDDAGRLPVAELAALAPVLLG